MARPSVKVAYVNGDQTLIANLEVYKDRDDGRRSRTVCGSSAAGWKASPPAGAPSETGELRSRVFNEGPLRDGDTYVQVVGYEKFRRNLGEGEGICRPGP